jgi:hypothetical protein
MPCWSLTCPCTAPAPHPPASLPAQARNRRSGNSVMWYGQATHRQKVPGHDSAVPTFILRRTLTFSLRMSSASRDTWEGGGRGSAGADQARSNYSTGGRSLLSGHITGAHPAGSKVLTGGSIANRATICVQDSRKGHAQEASSEHKSYCQHAYPRTVQFPHSPATDGFESHP